MPVYLVDGHALAYRSHYAFIRQPLINSKGEETSAVFGFLNLLLGIIDKYEPEYLAVVFDAAEKTFRHDMYEDYKANRPDTPDALINQLPVIMAMVDAMAIPQLSLDGYEADDIIATVTHRLPATPVRIVSGDKDLLQLVDEHTRVIRPGRGNVLENELDAAGVEAVMGLRPEQVVDYLALMGDTSDNVPGVRGIGEKTARKLLGQFGTLENVYARIDDVTPPSVQKKLIAGKEDALLSKRLVTLDRDVPVAVALDGLRRGDYHTGEFRALLEDLEFNRVIQRRFAAGPPPPSRNPAADRTAPASTAAGEGQYRLVEDAAALAELAEQLAAAGEFAVDVETSGLDPMRAALAGISVSTEPGTACYVPVRSVIEEEATGGQVSLLPASESRGLELDVVREHLAAVFADERVGKIGQNIKYDAIVLLRAGMPLSGISFDTMLASYCLDPARRSHSLDALALELCGHTMIPFDSLFDKRTSRKDIRKVPLERVVAYACEDADYTLRLKEVFQPLLDASQVKALFTDIEMPLERVLMDMELFGVRVDTSLLSEMSRRYDGQIGRLEERIYDSVGERFNINSTQKLREVLFDKLKLEPSRRTKTGFSTDVDVLKALEDQHEAPGIILEYRQLVKLKNTYIDALPRLVHPDTGRVHTSYNQAVTTTGRLSSSDPNLQNIPIRTTEGREIRKAFVSGGEGWTLIDADYSQIELRILAHISKDAELIRAFRDDADVHRRTAARVMNVSPDEVTGDMRSRAKVVNFGIIYGMGARGLSQALDIELPEAKQFIDDYFESYPGVKRFIDETIASARENKSVCTLLGRARRLPDIDSGNGRARAFSERIAVNTPVQGTAADIIKLAMLELDREIAARKLRGRMILQVHDELLFDVPDEEVDEMKELVRKSMEGAMLIDVPLKVDMGVGRNWLEAH